MSQEILNGLDEIVEEPKLPEAELNVDPPQDKLRGEDGKFTAAEDKQKEKEESKPELKEKVIPVAAHAAERAEWKRERDQWIAEKKELQERLSKLESPPKPEAPTPEYEKDPKGFVQHTVESRVKAALDQLEGVKQQVETGQKTAEQARAEAQEAQFAMALQATEAEFKSANPDYYDALTHLRTLRVTELSTLHPDATQEQIIAFMQQEERQLARNMLMSGRNPHQIAYQLAKARGYAPKQQQDVLPDVPGQKKLPPDQTMGSGSGSPSNAGDVFIDDESAFDLAMTQVFGRKKAS